VIHAATMELGGPTSAEVIREATASTLSKADELGAKSLGLVADRGRRGPASPRRRQRPRASRVRCVRGGRSGGLRAGARGLEDLWSKLAPAPGAPR
jgi:hypothetical protein